VPRNQGPWFGYVSISVWVPNCAESRNSFRERTRSMILRELIVNENLIS